MKAKGFLQSFSKDLTTGKYFLTFLVDEDLAEEYKKNKEILLDIEAKKHKEKRSLDANSYFHLLIRELAKYEKVGFARMKNEMIFQYGKFAFDKDGWLIEIQSKKEPDYFLNLESMHWCWIRTDYENDEPVYSYRLYEPTHNLNSADFSLLLDGVIAECKDRGIETITPKELSRMYEALRIKNG